MKGEKWSICPYKAWLDQWRGSRWTVSVCSHLLNTAKWLQKSRLYFCFTEYFWCICNKQCSWGFLPVFSNSRQHLCSPGKNVCREMVHQVRGGDPQRGVELMHRDHSRLNEFQFCVLYLCHSEEKIRSVILYALYEWSFWQKRKFWSPS